MRVCARGLGAEEVKMGREIVRGSPMLISAMSCTYVACVCVHVYTYISVEQ